MPRPDGEDMDKRDRNIEIHRRWQSGEPMASLARQFGLSAGRVRAIVQAHLRRAKRQDQTSRPVDVRD